MIGRKEPIWSAVSRLHLSDLWDDKVFDVTIFKFFKDTIKNKKLSKKEIYEELAQTTALRSFFFWTEEHVLSISKTLQFLTKW